MQRTPVRSPVKSPATLLLLGIFAVVAAGCKPPASADAGAAPHAAEAAQTASSPAMPATGKRLDLTGQSRIGTASFYAHKFFGRAMADGHAMDPHGDNAASKTLPLGTTAKVTSLETGRSTVVTIEDRGPNLQGRIVDLSPAAAKSIGIDEHSGIARVNVTPISVPLPDGRSIPGLAAPIARH